MNYILSDLREAIRIGEYTRPEDAVMVVGGLMTLYGINSARERYVLTEQPKKNGMARIVYDGQEMYGRALVYFNGKAHKKRHNIG